MRDECGGSSGLAPCHSWDSRGLEPQTLLSLQACWKLARPLKDAWEGARGSPS